ncbi:uncharacterized protein LOC143929552 [Lithobates pipiens]
MPPLEETFAVNKDETDINKLDIFGGQPLGKMPWKFICLLFCVAIIGGTVEATCDAQCPSVSVNVSTNQITVSGQVGGLVLQNITYTNGIAVVASDGSYNNTSLMTFVSGTQYIMHYGNGTNDCCYNFTTNF